MKFAQIIGQEELKSHLQNAIQMQKISHAYIINGEKDSGKMMLAESFASTLLCEEGGMDACGHCHSCKQADSHNQPDIIYVTHEKPNTISVEDIRVQLNHDIVTKPYAGKYKIYIIDEAEKMNEQAQNALLKTIEEPPAYAIIMLLTSNASSFLPTILSRCIQLDMKPVRDELIRKSLMQQYEIPDYQADVAVAFAQGNMGKAINLASSPSFNEMKDHVQSLVRRIDTMTYGDRVEMVHNLETYKDQMNEYLDLVMVWYRDVLLYKSTGQETGLINTDQIYQIRRQADILSYRHLEKITESVQEARSRLRSNVSFGLAMELLLDAMHEGME